MKRILFLLLGLTIAVGATADVNSWRDQHPDKKQEAQQAFKERVQKYAEAHKAQPQQHQMKERQARHESKAQAKPEFKIPPKKVAKKTEAVNPAKHQGQRSAEIEILDLEKLTHKSGSNKITSTLRDASDINPEGQEVITQQPEGDLVDYFHDLNLYDPDYQSVTSGRYHTSVVFAPDGETVYFKNLFPRDYGSWVRGTINGNKIIVPLVQFLQINVTGYGTSYQVMVWGSTVKNANNQIAFVRDPNVTEVTLTIGDNGVLTMDNTSAGANGDGVTGLSVINDAGDCWGVLYGSVYTPNVAAAAPEIITNQPEGEQVFYNHTNAGIFASENGPQPFSGNDRTKIVYATDGVTVYVKNPVAAFQAGSWVKGTISGNTITVKLEKNLYCKQYLYYDEQDSTGYYLAWGTSVKNPDGTYTIMPNSTVKQITYTIDSDGNITLDNATSGDDGDGASGLIVVYDDGDEPIGIEWESLYTPWAIPDIIYDQPEGELATYMYTCNYYWLDDNEVYNGTSISHFVYAPDGETVYLQFWNGAPWLTGTITGNKIHMPLGQYTYFNEGDGYGEIYAWGSVALPPDEGKDAIFVQDNTVTEVTFTINDGGVITMDNSSGGVDGIGAVGLADITDDGEYAYYVEWGSTFTPYVEPTVITEQPEGELVTYQRSGYMVYGYNIYNQEGDVDIVFAPDGETVYIKNLIYFDDFGTWVRGTIENGKLHVPLGQYIYLGDGYGFFIGWGQSYLDSNNYWRLSYDPTVTEATYTIDGGLITLDNSSFGPDDGPDGATGLAIVVDVEPDYLFQVEVGTQFYTPTAITEQPDGELVQYLRHGNWIYESGSNVQMTGLIDIVYAPDGETVYIKDPIYYSKNGTWVMGTLEDDVITVPLGQILSTEGKYNTVLAWGKSAYSTNSYRYEFTPLYDKTAIQYMIYGDEIDLMDGWQESWSTYYGPAAMQDGTDYAPGVEYYSYFTLYDGPTVITEQPAGQLVTYQRTGSGFYRNEEVYKKANGDRYIDAPEIKSQASKAYVVYAADGQTVYLKDPVYCGYQYNRENWVQGTLSADGTKITVPLGQYVSWDYEYSYGDRLAWGSTTLQDLNPDDEYGTFELVFTLDDNVTEVTYTIENGCISLDNSSGGSYQAFQALLEQYFNGDMDDETFEQQAMPMFETAGLVYIDMSDEWTGEINWGTMYVNKHPATLPDPVILEWIDYGNENGSNRLEVEEPTVDTDGLPIFDDALSYSIYTDNDQLFTFEADLYNLDEDVTEVTADMWKEITWQLRPGAVRFYRTNAEGYEPFFNWRIGIQFHYTADGVKNSTNIVYLEVFEKPEDPGMPGDLTGDGMIDINDITSLIHYVLTGNPEGLLMENADYNHDNMIDINDITDLIARVLNGAK